MLHYPPPAFKQGSAQYCKTADNEELKVRVLKTQSFIDPQRNLQTVKIWLLKITLNLDRESSRDL